MAFLFSLKNNKTMILLFLLFKIFQVSGYEEGFFGVIPTNYTIQDIENFKPVNSYPCPKESSFNNFLDMKTRQGEDFQSCDYQYLCNKKDEKCLLFNAPMGLGDYSSPAYDNSVHGKAYDIYQSYKRLILVGCSKERYHRETCTTDTCESNDDCYSDSCVNGVCMANKENPIYLCRTVKEDGELKVKCLSSFEEECKENKDCADNANCTKDKVCVIEKIPEKYPQNYTIIIIIAILAIIIIILVLLFILYKKGKIGKKN